MASRNSSKPSEEIVRRHRQDKRSRANAQRKLSRYGSYQNDLMEDDEEDYQDLLESPTINS
jgi:hypothetical protein